MLGLNKQLLRYKKSKFVKQKKIIGPRGPITTWLHRHILLAFAVEPNQNAAAG